jgi:hypothetical protein
MLLKKLLDRIFGHGDDDDDDDDKFDLNHSKSSKHSAK